MAWWRCLLCPARGTASSRAAAEDDGQQHYINTHMNKERKTT